MDADVAPAVTETVPDMWLSAADADGLATLARSLTAAAPGRVDDVTWVAAARCGWEDTPAVLRRSIRAFRRDSGRDGRLLIRGFPVPAAELPPTPSVGGSVQVVATVPAAMLVMVACGLGDPTAFQSEKSGALVQDVVPVPGSESFQSNEGSALLSFHIENAFHPHRPDYVLLLCLRADHAGVAGLRTSCIRSVQPLLDPHTRDALFAPEYVTAAPPSFGVGTAVAERHAVLSGAPEDPDLRVDLAATEAVSPRARAALGRLGELFELTAHTVRLAPGDLAIVDNRVTVHGRTAFQPRYDGCDRWLQRTFVSVDLRRSRALRAGDGHVLVG
jgi:L-asparagine oxygenase